MTKPVQHQLYFAVFELFFFLQDMQKAVVNDGLFILLPNCDNHGLAIG